MTSWWLRFAPEMHWHWSVCCHSNHFSANQRRISSMILGNWHHYWFVVLAGILLGINFFCSCFLSSCKPKIIFQLQEESLLAGCGRNVLVWFLEPLAALFKFVGETSKERKNWSKNRLNDIRSYLAKHIRMWRLFSTVIPEKVNNISSTLKTLKSRDSCRKGHCPLFPNSLEKAERMQEMEKDESNEMRKHLRKWTWAWGIFPQPFT